MPRPVRTVKPPSAPSATAKTIIKKTTTIKAATKPRTTRSGTKDIPDNEPGAVLPILPIPAKKSPPTKKTTAKAAVTKRSTRSKVPTTTTNAQTPSPPKQRTTRRKPAAKEPAPEPEPEKKKAPEPLLPTTAVSLSPLSSPEIQVPASSNAENRTPTPDQVFASSPPPMPSTPLQAKPRRRVVLEFGSDAGYSPPPAKLTSAERPRLRELQPLSLEPLEDNPPNDEDESEDPRASPTPKRGPRSGFRVIEDEEPPTSAQPERHGPAPKPAGGIGFYVPGNEETFIIYSDPKSPTPSLPPASTLDDTMRPPESSPSTTPVKTRKRRSSGAVVDSDEDAAQQADIEDEAEVAADRKGKRRKAQAEKLRLMKTDDLRDLLPRRKRNTKNVEKDEFDVLSTSEDTIESEEAEESADELSRPAGRTTRSGRAGKKTVAKTTKKSKKAPAKSAPKRSHTTPAKNAAVNLTKSAWSKPLPGASVRVGKTYTRKSLSSEKENDSPVRNRKGSAVNVGAVSSSGSEETVVIADGVVEKSGRRKLKEVVEKFKEVDRWEMEFEDVSPRSLEVSEEGR